VRSRKPAGPLEFYAVLCAGLSVLWQLLHQLHESLEHLQAEGCLAPAASLWAVAPVWEGLWQAECRAPHLHHHLQCHPSAMCGAMCQLDHAGSCGSSSHKREGQTK